MRRDLPWDELVTGVLPFLITRQIFAGAGKIGIEAESAGGQPGVFQISQRADFFTTLVSIDTMNQRPLVNTRDEPHADADRYRRFRSEEHTSELQSQSNLVCRLPLEQKQ